MKTSKLVVILAVFILVGCSTFPGRKQIDTLPKEEKANSDLIEDKYKIAFYPGEVNSLSIEKKDSSVEYLVGVDWLHYNSNPNWKKDAKAIIKTDSFECFELIKSSHFNLGSKTSKLIWITRKFGDDSIDVCQFIN